MCDREAAGKRENGAARTGRKEKPGKRGAADRAKGKAEKRGAADRAEGKVCRQLCGGGEDKQNLRFVEHGEEWN